MQTGPKKATDPVAVAAANVANMQKAQANDPVKVAAANVAALPPKAPSSLGARQFNPQEQAAAAGSNFSKVAAKVESGKDLTPTGQHILDYEMRKQQGAVTPPPVQPVQQQPLPAQPGVGVPPVIDAAKEKEQMEGAFGDFQKDVQGNVIPFYERNQEQQIQVANDNFAAQQKLLADLEAKQTELAGKRDSIISSSADVQKQEVQNQFDSNMRDVELQRKKVSEAYEDMLDEQELLNRQRKVREETTLGMVYGGFGSVAANKNLEDTIMQGERAVVKLKKDAINADTEIQNEITDLRQSYGTDIAKIEQWKSEKIFDNYAQLQEYIMGVRKDEMMATVDKNNRISDAVSQYNNKVAEVNASTATMRYQLSQQIIQRSEEIAQRNFDNQLRSQQEFRAQEAEKRSAESFKDTQRMNSINESRANLDLLMNTYANKDWSTLSEDVQKRMEELTKESGLPKDFVQSTIEMVKEANAAKENKELVKEDEDGNVTVVRYNFDTGTIETMELGTIGKGFKETAQKTNTELRYNPVSGEEEVYDKDRNVYLGPPGQAGQTNADFNGWSSTVGSGEVTQDFNTPVSYFKDGRKTHSAYDIDGAIGDPVNAPVAGKIVEIGNKGGWGNTVVIEDAQGNQWRLAHFDSLEKLNVGDQVSNGQFLGPMGNTGNVIKGEGGDGSHLHIEVKDSAGKLIDPGGIKKEEAKAGIDDTGIATTTKIGEMGTDKDLAKYPDTVQNLAKQIRDGKLDRASAITSLKDTIINTTQQANYLKKLDEAVQKATGKSLYFKEPKNSGRSLDDLDDLDI